jgi:hypothetical protein
MEVKFSKKQVDYLRKILFYAYLNSRTKTKQTEMIRIGKKFNFSWVNLAEKYKIIID